MRLRKLIAGAAAAVLLCTLAGCGNVEGNGSNNGNVEDTDGGRRVDLVLWGAADDQAMLSELVDEFKASDPDKDYNIVLRVNGEDVARDEALKDIDAAADVFAIANDQLGALVNADAIYQNTVYESDIRKSRTESSVSAATIDGKLYGYPSSAETYFLFYDKRYLSADEVGSLESIMAKKQPSGVAPFGYDFSDAYFSSAFFMTAGCTIYGENGQDPTSVDFNTDNGIAAAKYIAWLKSQGAEDMTGDVAGARFTAGKLAAFVSGDWKTEAYREALGDNLGVAPLPTINIGGEDRPMVSFAGGKMYVVKSTTKHPVEAMELAAFLTSEESQLKRFEQRQLLPTHTALSSDDAIANNEAIAAEVSQLEHSVATPSITQMSKYWDPVAAFTKDVFDGKIAEKDYKAKLDTLVSDITA